MDRGGIGDRQQGIPRHCAPDVTTATCQYCSPARRRPGDQARSSSYLARGWRDQPAEAGRMRARRRRPPDRSSRRRRRTRINRPRNNQSVVRLRGYCLPRTPAAAGQLRRRCLGRNRRSWTRPQGTAWPDALSRTVGIFRLIGRKAKTRIACGGIKHQAVMTARPRAPGDRLRPLSTGG